jgi:hypothetical protein
MALAGNQSDCEQRGQLLFFSANYFFHDLTSLHFLLVDDSGGLPARSSTTTQTGAPRTPWCSYRNLSIGKVAQRAYHTLAQPISITKI